MAALSKIFKMTDVACLIKDREVRVGLVSSEDTIVSDSIYACLCVSRV